MIASRLAVHAILFLIIAVDCIHTHQTPLWTTRDFSETIDNLITDPKDGSIYVAVGKEVRSYGLDLQNLSTANSIRTNSENEFLFILLQRDNSRLLLSCWRTENSTLDFRLHQVPDLGRWTQLFYPENDLSLKIDENERIRVVQTALNDQNKPISVIFLSSRMIAVNSQDTPYLPALSRYEITKNQQHKRLHLSMKSVLPYRSKIPNHNLYYDYIYAYEHEDYTHFLLNDIRVNQTHSQNNVRLARICNNDTALTSYTEISLPCGHHKNLYAKVAHFHNDDTLLVVSETYEQRREPERSVLCSYHVGLIQDVFNKAVHDCHSGQNTSPLLLKLHSNSTAPPCSPNPSRPEGWCNSRANPYIDGTSNQLNLREDYILDLGKVFDVNFVHLSSHASKTNIFIGNEAGHLSYWSKEDGLFYTANFNDNSVETRYEKNSKLMNDNKKRSYEYSTYLDNIVVSSGKQLHVFETNPCTKLSSCHDCLSLNELECVWCHGGCQWEKRCNDSGMLRTQCPPIIRDFYPKTLPLTGFTELHVLGDNFGSYPKGFLNVTVGDKECKHSNHSDHEFVCTVQPVGMPQKVDLNLSVDDRDLTYIWRHGETTAPSKIQFMDTTVYGVYPAMGPIRQSTTVHIIGENLNIGYNRTVQFDDVDCEIKESTEHNITCEIQPSAIPIKNETELHNSVLRKALKFKIDGIQQRMVPASSYKGFNLTSSFEFRGDLDEKEENHLISSDSIHADDGFSVPSWLIIFLFVIILIVALYLFGIKQDMTGKKSSIDSGRKMSTSNSIKMSQGILTSEEPLIELEGEPLMYRYIDKNTMDGLEKERVLLDRQLVTFCGLLGKGQFGQVCKGLLKLETGERIYVAVKTLRERNSWDDPAEVVAFLDEGLVMKNFQHENVLSLIGVSIDAKGLPMVITPFMKYGDLKTYITDDASSPTTRELIDFGTQVARGMAYLTVLKFVHRDLAARNCMLDENMTVKIADFGLSRDIYEQEYYCSDNKKTKLPVRWMAIESLKSSIYNTKTDVWSYGVLLWELMTRGVMPYPDVDNFDLLRYLESGRRMLRPRLCPVVLYKIMLSCWDENPANRPTFDELERVVANVVNQLIVAEDGHQEVIRDSDSDIDN